MRRYLELLLAEIALCFLKAGKVVGFANIEIS